MCVSARNLLIFQIYEQCGDYLFSSLLVPVQRDAAGRGGGGEGGHGRM
jgi:hypothetical protein